MLWSAPQILLDPFLNILNHIVFLDRRQRGPIKSVLLVIIGWLVCNAVFSKTTQGISLIFCMMLGDYKVRKVAKPHFGKKILDLEIFAKTSPN